MRHIWCISLAIALAACGCNATPQGLPADPFHPAPVTKSDLVGTWELAFVTNGTQNKKYPVPSGTMYMRFYADETVATWPVPDEELIYNAHDFNTDDRRVSHGKYRVENGELVLVADKDMRVPVQLTGDELSYRSQDADQGGCTYRRMRPDLEPGAKH